MSTATRTLPRSRVLTHTLRWLPWVAPLFVALLAVPFVVHQNAWFEWANALWFLDLQTAHVSAHGTPTFFLHAAGESFYPVNVFYAGPLISLLAYPAAIVGPWPVFAFVTVAAGVAGYYGIVWAARNVGVPARLAPLPGLVFAATPYVVSDLYGRGAWAELIAVNAVAVLVGALTQLVLRPERPRTGAYAALIATGAIIAGTHNLTLLMATISVPFMIVVLLPLAPEGTTVKALAGRLGGGMAFLALGVGLTGAWLIPNLWLAPDTAISSDNAEYFTAVRPFATLGNLLSPWPRVPGGQLSTLYTQVPALALLWAIVAVALTRWQRRRDGEGCARIALTAAGIVVVALVLLALAANTSWWLHFPRLVMTVQFPFRVVPYIGIATALAVAVALTTLGRRRLGTGLLIALGCVVALQIAGAAYIALHTPAASVTDQPTLVAGDIRASITPPSYEGPGYAQPVQFRVVGQPTAQASTDQRITTELGNPARDDVGVLTGRARAGQTLSTDVVWSPLIRLDGGLAIEGRDDQGFVVARVTRVDDQGTFHATARSAGDAPWQVLAGRVVTILSVLILGALGAVLLRRRTASAVA